MLSYNLIERFAKSPLKITIGVCLVIIFLVLEVNRLNAKVDSYDAKTEIREQAFRKEIQRKDSLLNDCGLQSKISADNQIKATQLERNEYKALYLKTLELQAAAEKKGINSK